jgi:hypothetical protein
MAAARTRSWYVLHALASMTVLFVVLMLGLLAYSFSADKAPDLNLPLPIRVFGALCVLALLWLWIRMLIDFFRERPARHPVAWGFVLVLGSYIGALAYFWAVWRPRNRPHKRGVVPAA